MFKKILKVVLLLILIGWLALEAYVFYEHREITRSVQEAYARGEKFIPVHPYRPFVTIIPALLFPSLGLLDPAKPVIYLYPEETTRVKVQLDYEGEIFADYPAYDYSQKGWTVTAHPDGKIINHDGREYSYLFWEGIAKDKPAYDLSKGFVVRGEDTVEFLQKTLSELGLIPEEYNEFIVYWYPKMQNNRYNLIHFAREEYTNTAPLTITPEPDSMLRVFMVYKPLDKFIDVRPQEIKPFTREGFTAIEWGGTEIR